MPLTAKGEEIKAAMQEQYGAEKGEEVFYASKNAGTISGVDDDQTKHDPHTGQFTSGPGGAGAASAHHEKEYNFHKAAAEKHSKAGNEKGAAAHSTAAAAHLNAAQKVTTKGAAGHSQAAQNASKEAQKVAPTGRTPASNVTVTRKGGVVGGPPPGYTRGASVREGDQGANLMGELSNTDEGMLDPLLPEPTLEHPQQHPDASTPPEPAYTGPPADQMGADELRAAYGGLTGGCNPQGTFGSDWDCTVDAGRAFDQATVVEAPPGMPLGEIMLQNAGYWLEHGVAPGPEVLVPTHAVDEK
jgi:hypothetical protein